MISKNALYGDPVVKASLKRTINFKLCDQFDENPEQGKPDDQQNSIDIRIAIKFIVHTLQIITSQ